MCRLMLGLSPNMMTKFPRKRRRRSSSSVSHAQAELRMATLKYQLEVDKERAGRNEDVDDGNDVDDGDDVDGGHQDQDGNGGEA